MNARDSVIRIERSLLSSRTASASTRLAPARFLSIESPLVIPLSPDWSLPGVGCSAYQGRPAQRPRALPAAIGAIAFQNKAALYDLLFRTAAETLTTIAADPKHLGARIGLTAVLHTWGSALTHHPHVHVIVPGGGLSPDGSRWIACKPRRAPASP